jgi:hypothetical protein
VGYRNCFALGTHLSRHLNRPAVEKKFLGQRGFPGIRVRNDRKGAPTRNFVGQIQGVLWCV